MKVLQYICLGFLCGMIVVWVGCSSPSQNNNQNANQSNNNNQNNQNANQNQNQNANQNNNASVKRPIPVVGATAKLVPNPDFPKEVVTQTSNNNLDVAELDGRFYLAFRTAPNHFASEKTELFVVSSTDQKTWQFEAKYAMNTDLREPRFFLWKGTIQLYFAQLGSDQGSFEPGQMFRSERVKAGEWTKPEKVFKPGFIPWRFREYQGKPLMVGYDGGENIYNFTGKPLHVYLLTTTDGKTWTPYNPKREFVLQGGTSETDIAFDDKGNLFAVARNEAGDSDGFGSKICTAPKSDITHWTCKADPRKYDSPLLFRHGSEIYLVGRRNMTETGHYDLGKKDLDHKQKLAEYQFQYWQAPKRCSIWRLDRKELKIIHLTDLPSRGDTCFPSILKKGDNQYVLYNYSSDINGPDRTWLNGQTSPTFIYSHELRFTLPE